MQSRCTFAASSPPTPVGQGPEGQASGIPAALGTVANQTARQLGKNVIKVILMSFNAFFDVLQFQESQNVWRFERSIRESA